LQEALPSAEALQESAYLPGHWKHDIVENTILQVAVVQHLHVPSGESSLCRNMSTPNDVPYASTGLGSSFEPTENFLPSLTATVALSEDSDEEHFGADGSVPEVEVVSDHLSTSQFPSLCAATVNKYQTFQHIPDDFQQIIEDLSSLCVDAGLRQGSDNVPSGRHHLTNKSSSSFGNISSSEQASAATRVGVGGDSDATEDGTVRREGTECERTHTCNPYMIGGACREAVKNGLLGESGEVIKAVHEALKEIEDVHSSDELMHFEFFGPFWELSEV
jgi:hypothetical protein